MAKTHTDGEYVAALETKSQMDALVHQLFINERRGKPNFKTQEEFDKAYHEFETRYYNSLPSESSQITGWTRAAFHAFESATHELTNFKDPDRGTMDATQTFVKSGFTNALLQAMTQDTSALKTVQSGQELIKGVIARDAKIRFTTTHEFAVNANMTEQKRAFENIFAHGGKYMNFDVEDIGDYITQYSFGTFDPTLGKHLNVVKDSVRSGMIGLNKQAHDAAMALVDEYEKTQLARNGKIGVPKEKEYMLREFMKMGLAGDNAWKQEENGRIKLLKYASNEDAQVYDVNTMRKGIETLFQINKAATQQMFDFHGHKMYRYEIDAAESFMNASKNGGLTLSSTNGLGHDIPMFEKMFGRNGFASEGAKAWFQEFTNGTGRLGDSINHLDVTAVGRELVSDAFVRQHPEAAAEAYRKGEFFNSAEGNWQAYIPGEDQTAILEEVGSFIGGADQKHTSEADMLKQGANLQYMIDQWKDVDKDYLARLQQTGKANGRTDASIFGRIGPEHTAAGGQLFYVNDGQFAKNSTGFSLMFDASSGEYRFANNVRVGKEARGDIVTTGIKKNTVAMLVAAPKELDFKSVEGEKLLDTAMQAGFEPNGEKLFAASFVTYGEQKYNGHRNIYTIVGSQDELQKFFQKNSYAGEFSKESIKSELARQMEAAKGRDKLVSEWISSYKVLSDRLSQNRQNILTAIQHGQLSKDLAEHLDNAGIYNTNVSFLVEDERLRREYSDIYERLNDALGRRADAVRSFAKDHPEMQALSQKVRMAKQERYEKAKAGGLPDKDAHKKLKSQLDTAKAELQKALDHRKDIEKQIREVAVSLDNIEKKVARLGDKNFDTTNIKNVTDAQEKLEKLHGRLEKAQQSISSKQAAYEKLRIQYDVEGNEIGEFFSWMEVNKQELDGYQKEYGDFLQQSSKVYHQYDDEIKDIQQELSDHEKRRTAFDKSRLASGQVVTNAEWKALQSKSNKVEPAETRKAPSAETVKKVEELTAGWTQKDWVDAALDYENRRAADVSTVDSKTKRRLSYEYTGKDGKKHIGNRIDGALRHSMEVSQNDTAGNWLRDMSYKKANRILDFLDIYTKFSSDFFGFDTEIDRAQNRSKISEAIFRAYEKGGEFGKTAEQKKAYQELVKSLNGLMKTGSDYPLYSNTIRQMVATVGWESGMKDVLSAVVQKTQQVAGSSDKDVLEGTYQQVYQNTLANLAHKANQQFHINLDPQDALGKGSSYYVFNKAGQVDVIEHKLPRMGEQINSFEIDITGIMQNGKLEEEQQLGSRLRNKFVIDLDKKESFGKRLARQLGYTDPDNGQVVTALRKLGRNIYEQYGEGNEELEGKLQKLRNINDQPYTAESAMALIREQLGIIRKANPNYGYVDGVTLADIDHAPTAVRLLNEEIDGKDISEDEKLLKKQEAIKAAVEEASQNLTKVEVKRKPKEVAEDLTEKLFEKTESVSREDLSRHGYSKVEIDSILADRSQRKLETKQFLEIVLDKTYGVHSDWGYKIEGDNVYLKTDSGKMLNISKYLPYDHFDEAMGTFRTIIGGRSLATTKIMTWDVTDGKKIPSMGSMGIHSLIGEYANNVAEQLAYTNSGSRSSEENLKNVDYFMRQALDPIVDKAVTKFDKEDTKLGKYLDFSVFYNRLGLYNAQGAFNDVWSKLSDSTQTALRSMTARLQKAQAEHPNEVVDEVAPKTQEMIAILGDFHRLVAPLADAGSKLSSLVFRDRADAEDFVENYAGRINLQGIKHPEKGYVSLARSSDVFGGLGPDPRHFDSVLSRAHELQNVDRFRDVVLNGDKDLARTTQLDSIILTPEEALQRKNGGGALHAVRTTHLTMNQTEWEEFLAKDKVQELFQRDLGISTSQFHAYLNESGALINGALLDLGKKNIEQKMRTDELIDTVKMASIIGKDPEAKAREEELRKHTNEIIELGKDSVSYKYSADYVVLDKGDTMAWNESFKGMPTDAKAEREGFLKKRYYKDGKEVSEAEINAVLNREENVAALQKEKEKFAVDESLEGAGKKAAIAKQNAALRSAAHEILKHEGYKQSYALESPDAMPTRKVLLGTEKAEARFGMPPLGQIAGSEVAGILGTTKEKLASEFPLQYLTGDVLGDMNKLNALLRHHGFNELNETQFNDLGKAVRADQKKFWSTLNQALRDQNYIAKDEYVNAISATEFEAAKGSHSEVARMRTRINESVDLLARAMAAKDNKKISPEYIQRASDTIQKDLAGVFRSSDGKDTLVRSADAGTGNESFTVGRPDDVNVTKFNQVMAKYNPDFKDYTAGVDGAVRIEAAPAGGGAGNISIKVGDTYQTIKGPYTYDANGRMIAKTGITELRFADDADEGRINSGDERGIKVTRRMTTALEKDIYSNAGIQKTYENMVKLENFVGKDAYDAEKNFNEMYRGIASVKRNDKGELSLDIEKDAAGRNINDAIIKNLHEEVIAGTDSSMQITTWNPKQNERVYRSLEDAGINRKHAEKIVASLNDQGFNRIGADTLKNEYAYATGRLATSFDKEMEKAVTAADKQNIVDKYIGYGLLGDKVIDISNVSFERQNTNGDLNNLLERQGIVKVGDNYVAVGYEPTSIMDNDNGQGVHDMTDTRSKLRDVQRQYTDRLNETTGEQRTEAEHQLQEKINDFASTQEKSVTSKGGALARTGEAYLQDSAMFKANIIRVRNGNATVNGFKGTDMEGKAVSANELLKTAKVNGVSIAEHEAAGHAVNATFVGRGFFENMVKGKDFQQALATTLGKDVSNLTEDDTKQALENILRQASVKGGTGIELRQPLEYLGSVQGMHIFYDSSLSSNQALVTEAAAKIQKADQDGDTIFAHMSRSEAVVQGANSSEKIRLNQLQVASLNAVAGRNVASFEDDGAQLRQIDRAGDSVANVTSSNVPPLDKGNSLEETFWTKNGYDNQKVNGHIYDVSGFSSNEINTQEDKMNDIIGSERFQKFVNRKYGINMADSQNDDTKEFAKDLVHNIAEYEYGGDTLHIADDYVKDLQKHGMGAEAKEATKAFGVSFANMANKDTLAKTMARMNAGINNMNSYRFNTLVNSLQDAGLTDYRSGDHIIVGHVLEHINDAFQAPKNSTSANQIDSREFGEALQDFFGARTGRRDTTKLYKILGDMYDDGIKELKNLPQIEGLETNGGMISKERMFQAMDHVMQSDQVLNPVAWEQARVGYANSEIESKYRTTNTNDIKSVSDNVTNALLEENGAGELDLKDAPLTVASRSVAAQHSIFDDDNHDHFMNSAAEDAEEAGLEDTIKGTFRTIGHALSHGGAKAMLGFAGAMMMAGMTGGAPTSPTPAQGQAKGIQSENAMYEIPPSMPSGALGRTQPQSYIINVNASTSRGRDFATQAINQAMASMPQTSSGNQMTMNIKDSSSSIGFGDIANYVSGML